MAAGDDHEHQDDEDCSRLTTRTRHPIRRDASQNVLGNALSIRPMREVMIFGGVGECRFVLALSEVSNERSSAYLQRSHPFEERRVHLLSFTDWRRFISPAIVFGRSLPTSRTAKSGRKWSTASELRLRAEPDPRCSGHADPPRRNRERSVDREGPSRVVPRSSPAPPWRRRARFVAAR